MLAWQCQPDSYSYSAEPRPWWVLLRTWMMRRLRNWPKRHDMMIVWGGLWSCSWLHDWWMWVEIELRCTAGWLLDGPAYDCQVVSRTCAGFAVLWEIHVCWIVSQVEFVGVLWDKYVGGLQDWLHVANVIVRLASIAEPAIRFVSLRILYEFEHMLCQPTCFRSLSVACACKLLAGCVGRSNLLGNVDRRSDSLLQNRSTLERFFPMQVAAAQLFNFGPFILRRWSSLSWTPLKLCHQNFSSTVCFFLPCNIRKS